MSRNERLRGVGRNPEPRGQNREEGIIRLVESRDGEPATEAADLSPVARAKPRRPEREGLMRAEVGVLALREGLGTRDLDSRRESYLLARSELRRSIRHVEADLDRLPPSELGPWRVEEEKLKRMFEKWGRERRAREAERTSGLSADGLDGRSA